MEVDDAPMLLKTKIYLYSLLMEIPQHELTLEEQGQIFFIASDKTVRNFIDKFQREQNK